MHKRKREDDHATFNKKPRFDTPNQNRWATQSFYETDGADQTPSWAYRRNAQNPAQKRPRWNNYSQPQNSFPAPYNPKQTFPPPVVPAEATEAPESVEEVSQEEPPEPIPALVANFVHSTFWHRSIGSVYPPIPHTHFATSRLSNVPSRFLPARPKNVVQGEFSPHPQLYHMKLLPQKLTPAGQNNKSKRNKPVKFLHVFQSYNSGKSMEAICQHWRGKYVRILDHKIYPEDGEALCRNLNLWFGQFCLVCEKELSHKSAGPHFRGKSHLRKFLMSPIVAKYERVDPIFLPEEHYEFKTTTKEHKKPFPLYGRTSYGKLKFLQSIGMAGTSKERILVLGDFDMTFSLGIDKATQKENTIVCAPFTKSFEAVEADQRIQRNIKLCKKFNIEILEDIDLFDPNTLKFEQPFHKVFVLFPRVSFLTNLADPLNTWFMQDLFRSVNKNGVIRPDGYLLVLMKRREFIDWDACTVALQEKLYLQRAVVHHTGALHPFEPRQPAGGSFADLNSKAKRLNGVKAPLYYVFARTRDQGMSGINPWIAQPVVRVENGEDVEPDAVLQNLEKKLKNEKEEIKQEIPAVKAEAQPRF